MSDRFYDEYRRRRHFQQRPSLPGPTRAHPTAMGVDFTSVGLFHDGVQVGSIRYVTGIAHQLHQPPLAANAPYLYQPVVPGNPAMPRLLIINGFDNLYENKVKGVGSALLREMLRIAEQGDCRYVVVQMGINHEAYTALGFDLIDADQETWCMTIERLRARLSPLRRAHEAP